MIRVLHVIATLDLSGAESQMVQLCCRLNRGAFDPMVCALTRGGPMEKPLKDAGVPVHLLHKRGRWDLRIIGRLISLMRTVRPTIVHTWLPTSNLLGTLAATAARVPIRITSERASDVWKGPLWRAADRMLAPLIHQVITNSDAVRQRLLERRTAPNSRIAVVHNGLDLASFDRASSRSPSQPLPEHGNRLVIGTVGRLEPQKGIPYLLQAFSRLPDSLPPSELWIIGAGPEEAALRTQAASLGIGERVVFLGLRNDVPAILKRLDLFVLPSLWEGLPNAVLEAMSASRPVVATSVDGTPEAVTHEKTGLLVPPRDPDSLTNAMARLLGDPDLRTEFGRTGRSKVESDFSMERMVTETSEVYDNMTARNRERKKRP